MSLLDRIKDALGGSGKPLDFKSLVEAAKKGDVSAFRLAVDGDPNVVKQTGSDGMTLLHFTAATGSTQIARLLLDAGAAVNAGNNTGWTPLHFAALQGDRDMAALLIRRGARTDVGGVTTPLDVARQYNRAGVISLLKARR